MFIGLETMKKVKIEVYGCSSNKADADIMRNILREKYEIVDSDPDVYVVAFAYCATNPPPVKVKAHPNVVIQYVGTGAPYDSEVDWKTQREEWDGWSRSGAKMAWRPNWLRAGDDMLMLYPHKVGSDIKYFAANGLIGTDFDTMMNDWASQGLNYYVMAKLLWNPDSDVDQIINDYCKSGFGPSSEKVKAFFSHVEKMTLEHANVWSEPMPWAETIIPFFSGEEFLSKADQLLDQARAKAEGKPELLARINFLADAVEFTRLRSGVIDDVIKYKQGKPVDLDALKSLKARSDLFLKTHKHSFAINTPYALYDQFRFGQSFSWD